MKLWYHSVCSGKQQNLMTTLLDGLFYFNPESQKLEPAINSTPGRVEKSYLVYSPTAKELRGIGTRKGLRIFDRANKRLVKPGVDKNGVIDIYGLDNN
ncbi:MAG: hypothetical protein WDO15_24610 [Bacteroidota bacterium]